MKLIACHIENFGKLSDLSMNFAEGINVINEANAWGKSTLAAFLKVMFYGFDSKKESGTFEKERVLYRPWQGGVYGGQVDFEVGGQSYRISRTFGRTEKTDEFHLYDLKTNLESNDFSANIGVELFDLDSGSFKRSIYIAQNDCVSDISDRINAKLGNLAENTDDINNFDSASRHLKDILNQLTPDRVTGSIKKRKSYIAQLAQELRAFESAQEGIEGVRHKEQLVSAQIEELTEIRQNYGAALIVASEESRKRELYTQYDALCKEVDEKEERVNELKACFPNGIPQKNEFKEQLQNVRNMENKEAERKGLEFSINEQEEWENMEFMFEAEVPDAEQIDTSIEMLSSTEKQKENLVSLETHLKLIEQEMSVQPEEPVFERVSHKIPMFAGIAISLAGIVILVLWYMQMIPVENDIYLWLVAAVIILCGLILNVIGILQGRRAAKERMLWQKSTAEEQEKVRQHYEDLKAQAEVLKENIEQVHSSVGSFLERFHISCKVEEYSAKLYEFKNQLNEYERLAIKQSERVIARKLFENEKEKVTAFIEQYGFETVRDISEAVSENAYGDITEVVSENASGYISEAISENESENVSEDITEAVSENISKDVSMDLANILALYQEKAAEYNTALAAYQEACKKREAFEKRQKKSFWTKEALCPYSIEELNQMIQQADAKIEELKMAKAQYTKQLEDLQEQLDLRDEKQAELGEQLILQEKDTQKYHIVKHAYDYLQKAKEQFTARYMDPIANGFSKYYQMLTGENDGKWVIDANINLKMKEQGELRDTRWLSAGYQDLLAICMRLALVEAMYKEEKPFLILDDPFVNLDKDKVAAGNQLLLEVAKEYQVIYFTCHDSRSPIKE